MQRVDRGKRRDMYDTSAESSLSTAAAPQSSPGKQQLQDLYPSAPHPPIRGFEGPRRLPQTQHRVSWQSVHSKSNKQKGGRGPDSYRPYSKTLLRPVSETPSLRTCRVPAHTVTNYNLLMSLWCQSRLRGDTSRGCTTAPAEA
jgi:hypothetical protein